MARCAPGGRRARKARRAAARRSRRRPSAEDAMDRIAEWRPVEPAGPDGTVDSGASQSPPVQPGSDTSAANRRLLGAVVVGLAVAICAVAGAIALIVLASAPKSAVSIDGQASPASSGLVASG